MDLLQAAVMLMVLVSVWRVHSTVGILEQIKLSYIAPGLALLAFIADHDPRRRLRRIAHPVLYRLLGVAAIIGLGIPTSLWPGESFDFLLDDHVKTLLAMVLIAVSVRSRLDIERYAMMHVVGAVYYSTYIMNNFRVNAKGRYSGLIYYDANDYGLLIVCTLPFCLYFLRPGAKTVHRIIALVALPVLMSSLVNTGSRGGFLGFLACGLFLLFKLDGVSKAVRVGAVGAMVAAMGFFGGSKYLEMMKTLLNPTADYNWSGDVGRKQIWKRGMKYMITHPLLGVGASAFPQAEGRLSPLAARQSQGVGLKWSNAHNSFVQVGAELGVIGLALFIAAIYASFRLLLKCRDPALAALSQTLAAVLVGYCVAGFFVSGGYSAFLYSAFGLVIGIATMPGGLNESSGEPARATVKRRGRRRYAPLPMPQPAAPVGGQVVLSRRSGLHPDLRRQSP